MKYKLLSHLLFAIISICSFSCSGDMFESPVENEYTHTYKLILNCSQPDFSNTSTRSGTNWEDGSIVYINFSSTVSGKAVYSRKNDNWTLYVNRDVSSAGSCSGRYYEGIDSENTALTAMTSVFEGTGTYFVQEQKVTVSIRLSPKYCRIRFKGQPGSQIKVTSNNLVHQININDLQSFEKLSENLQIDATGFSPYIYGLFASSDGRNNIELTFNGECYSKEIEGAQLLVGESGVLTLPESNNLHGWKKITQEDENNLPIVLWENNGNIGDHAWDGFYRFGMKDYDHYNECIATFDTNEWSVIKNGVFYLLYDGDEKSIVRIMTGWWSATYGGIDHNCIDMAEIDSETGNNVIKINIKQDGNLYNYIDEQHILFTGEYYTPLKLYYYKNENMNLTDEHEYVDLGLSVKWATCNLGANSPEEYGNYYAWGETIGYNEGKKSFIWNTYKWYQNSTYTKYCTDASYGIVDDKSVLEPEDDVANVKWGANWRLPSYAEFLELKSKCKWTWDVKNGIKGYMITSEVNGNSIFLPAAGHCTSEGFDNVGLCGYYWTNSIQTKSPGSANGLYFDSNSITQLISSRYIGIPVRPVCL